MGMDRGFDIYPPLQDTASDNEKWAVFLEAVISHYEELNDPNMTLDKAGNVVFTQGEHPTLRRKGYQFRRFSSKITGHHAGDVDHYLVDVQKIARKYFRDRVKPWHEGLDQMGEYEWNEVYAAAEEP